MVHNLRGRCPMFLKSQGVLSGVVAVLVLGTQFAKAEIYMDGNQLSQFCASAETTSQYVCESYVAGVIDYHSLIKTMNAIPTVEFCIPDGTKLSDLREAVAAYLSINKQHQNFAAAPAVALGLYEIYPCAE